MTKTNKGNRFAKAFQTGLSPAQNQMVESFYEGVVADVARRVMRQCGISLVAALDFAVEGALYALRSYVAGTCPWPKTADDWVNMATWKAVRCGFDDFAHARRVPMVSIDRAKVLQDGETIQESAAVVEASVRAWLDSQADEDRGVRRAAVRYALPRVVKDMNTKDPVRTLKIVKAVYMKGLPTEDVCRRFELKRNNLFQILFRFRDQFAKTGEEYMDIYEEYYADLPCQAA